MSNQLTVIKNYLEKDEIKERISNVLNKNAAAFSSALISLVGSNEKLQNCTPQSIMKAAMEAASLNLVAHPTLGLAYIIPYKGTAQFQLGYKGLIQLAIRSDKVKKIRAVEIFEDEFISYNYITGEIELNSEPSKKRESGKATPCGYYSRVELVNGFIAEEYMTTKEVTAHAKKYSQAYKNDIKYNNQKSPWSTDFDAMAKKTVLLKLFKFSIPLAINEMVAVANEGQLNSVSQTQSHSPQQQQETVIEAEVIDMEGETNLNESEDVQNTSDSENTEMAF